MSFKGIGGLALGLALLVAVPARALEERIVLTPGQDARRDSGPVVPAADSSARSRPAAFGSWSAEGAVLRPGYRGEPEYVIGHAAYESGTDTDLLLHFDQGELRDEAQRWKVAAGPAYAADRSRALLGDGAASFRGPDSALSLEPRPGSLLAPGARFRDFSLEFWLYPANAENGEVILMWQSIRRTASGILPQQLSCVVAGGRVTWAFINFFAPPEGLVPAGSPTETRYELRARSPLVPRTWSHHLLRFDGDTGLLEYLVNGVPEALTYATLSGREGGAGPGRGTVFAPAVGVASPLRLASDYAGLVDEFRLSSSFVEKPQLKPFGRKSAVVLSPIADLGFGHSRLRAIEAVLAAPGASGVELSYRIAEEYAGFRAEEPAWIPVRPGEALPESAVGRYVQIRAELFPDGSGRLSPALSSLTLRYEPNPPPPPPARVMALPRNGAIELRWSRVPEADLAGYLVYYGDAPGEYFGTGAAEGPSPIDAGAALSLVLSGLPNGRLLYIAVAAYDAAAHSGTGGRGGTPTTRAGEFSQEISARPSRTAP